MLCPDLDYYDNAKSAPTSDAKYMNQSKQKDEQPNTEPFSESKSSTYSPLIWPQAPCVLGASFCSLWESSLSRCRCLLESTFCFCDFLRFCTCAEKLFQKRGNNLILPSIACVTGPTTTGPTRPPSAKIINKFNNLCVSLWRGGRGAS